MVTPYSPPAAFLTSLGLGSVPAGVWTPTNVFPLLPGADIEIKRRQIWSTARQTAASGRERTTSLWSYPKYRFSIIENVIRNRASNPELDVIEEFFANRAGQNGPFVFFDPDQNAVTLAPAGTGDGVTTIFQLMRPVRTFTEPVLAPYTSSGFTVFVDGTPTSVTPGVNGLITFGSAPANGKAITWTGYYYFLCRFDSDEMEVAKMFSDLWSLDGVSFTSIKP